MSAKTNLSARQSAKRNTISRNNTGIVFGYNGAKIRVDTADNSNVTNSNGNTLYNGGTPDHIPDNFWGSPVYFAADGKTLLCPGFVGQTYAANQWDYIQLPQSNSDLIPERTPGICTVNCDKEIKVDHKKAAGQDGERVTYHGLKPANIDIQILIWTPDQFRVLQNIWQTYMPLANKSTKASSKTPSSPGPLDIVHPLLQFHGVKSIIILGGNGPAPGPVPRSRIFNIRAQEFYPLQTNKVQTKTPQSSVANVNNQTTFTESPYIAPGFNANADGLKP